MLTVADVNKYVESRLGEGKKTSQGVKFDCPNCAEDGVGKYNLEINLQKEIYKCWACKISGTLYNFMSSYSIIDDWKRFVSKRHKTKEVIIEDDKEYKLPEATVPFYLSEEAKKYLINERKLDESVLIKHKIRYCYSKDEELYNHIIFPYYENDKLIGFSSHNLSTKKYKNHRSLNFITYKEFINPYFPIIITEGIYDALSVINAIPLLGTKLNKEVLKFVKDKVIILAMDSDIKDIQSMIDELYFYGAKEVYNFTHQYKDLNEYRQQNLKQLKRDLIKYYE